MPTPPSTPEPDLFARAEQGKESGYDRWRAEVEVERLDVVARERAEELPQATDEAGHAQWRREMAEARLAFERQWGVPVGHRVRVMLRGEDREREGKLQVVEKVAPTQKLGLMLRLGGREFRAAEMVSAVRVENSNRSRD